MGTCLGVLSAGAASAPAQELTAATYDRLRAAIDVRPDELRWQGIAWRSHWDGLLEAQRLDRPIFYWTYFGDPRGGC
jgi:hypothetical protein